MLRLYSGTLRLYLLSTLSLLLLLPSGFVLPGSISGKMKLGARAGIRGATSPPKPYLSLPEPTFFLGSLLIPCLGFIISTFSLQQK